MTEAGNNPEAEDPEDRPDLARFCYACGDLNPIGLHLHFTMQPDGAAEAPFTAAPEHQGYPGFVHGGLVTTLLDEAMGWATHGNGIWALTGSMQLRFKAPVPAGAPLRVRGKITRDRGRALEAEAALFDSDGKVLAEATAVLFRATGEQARQIEAMARALPIARQQ